MALTIAPGFVDLKEIFDQRVTEVGWNVINQAVAISTQIWTAEMQRILETFAVRATTFKERYTIPGVTELQPLDGDSDNPKPVGALASYDVAYPVRDAGFAWGMARKTRAKMTVGEANQFTTAGLRADARWLIRHLLAAVYDNVAWTYVDPLHGSLSVQPLANGDSVEYVKTDGTTATDTHYLAQSSAIDDSNNPFDDIYDELVEHPDNVGEVVVYIPLNLKSSVMALANFVDVAPANVQLASTVNVAIGGPNTALGDELLGICDKCWIKLWKRLPDNYMIAHTDGAGPFMLMREEPETELQGLRPEFHNVDGNSFVTRLLRTAGFGAQRRTGALVYLIGSASYSIPSGYAAPLAI